LTTPRGNGTISRQLGPMLMENRSPLPQPAANTSEDICPPSVRSAPLKAEPYSDDMCDSEADRKKYPDLPLAECSTLLADYRSLDLQAIGFQNSHVTHTWIAALAGMCAVIAAIAELALSYSENHDLAKWILAALEILFVSIAGLTTLHGFLKKKKEQWLAKRHQAELYRQLKFKLLIHPRVWGDAAWRLAEINKFGGERTEEWLEKWLREEIESPPPHSLLEIEEQPLKWPVLRQLVEYYVAKRLNPQQEYLSNRAQRNQYKDFFRHWPDFLFFFSVGVAGVHFLCFVLERIFSASDSSSDQSAGKGPIFVVALFLLGIAAGLPVLAAAARTWRGAFEFSRNKSRFRATHTALGQVEISLLHDALAGPADPAAVDARELADRSLKVLRELWWAEHILCNEHHEWLRLMLETEWFP
jgi:hypothetical protein